MSILSHGLLGNGPLEYREYFVPTEYPVSERVTPSILKTGIQDSKSTSGGRSRKRSKNTLHEDEGALQLSAYRYFVNKTARMQLACSQFAVASVSRYGEASKELQPSTCSFGVRGGTNIA
jgi:hypothetical protein